MDGDGDTVTYSLSNIQQNDFTINATSGLITLTSTLDRETQKTESVIIMYLQHVSEILSEAILVKVRCTVLLCWLCCHVSLLCQL